MASDSFGTAGTLAVGDASYRIRRLHALGESGLDVTHLPYSLKILLENLLRHEDGTVVSRDDVEALVRFGLGEAGAAREIAFAPARILLQDFTGVPAVVDLAVVRDGVQSLGGRAEAVNPLVPVDLVIDHSVVADEYGTPTAFARNAELELQRNAERYRFLRWGAQAFSNFRVVPPDTGICHQVNLEHLASVVFTDGEGQAYPDTLVGTDSHTPMVNGLGILGWGVGGIEAEAALLGQPISMLIPQVIGFKLTGQLPEGTTATDLVLTVTEMLRSHGVVGKFVEFYGPGVANVPLENRATIGNMSPEYGSTVTIFPIDDETLRYLRFTGRPEPLVALVEAYAKEQGLWHDHAANPHYSATLELDLSSVRASLAGPSRPQDRVPLDRSKEMFAEAVTKSLPAGGAGAAAGDDAGAGTGRPHIRVPVSLETGEEIELDHGHVVIAAITSCTNTSNPAVMIGAALLARRAVEAGLASRPWVKTSLAPGSRVVMNYYERAGLLPYLEKLGFNLVGFGCTTCIGNSGPLPAPISRAINENGLAVVSVLSGNRNFEGRIHPDVRMSYLASPPLVVAYALAGTMDIDLYNEPLGSGADGRDVYLRDIWPSDDEIAAVLREAVRPEMFSTDYADVFTGDERWTSLEIPQGYNYAWDDVSTYVRRPPFLDGMTAEPQPFADISGARALAVLGDSVTTDHISPAGSIRIASPAGEWLMANGVEPADFNSYGARRGNHEVMLRGTFANNRIRNELAPGTEGGFTRHLPDGEVTTIFDASTRYADEGVPLVVVAGKEYGTGSSRDWAAKGTALLGVRAVIAESFERIHRSNLIGMGVLPLQFEAGASRHSLGISGEEVFEISGLAGIDPGDLIGRQVEVRAGDKTVPVLVRIDTLTEAEYYQHGGILPFIVRKLAAL
jgi:aconitate hydratase